MTTFTIGDLVLLKSGSMRMVVEDITDAGIATVWCNDGVIGRDVFAPELLNKAEPREDRGERHDRGGDARPHRGGFGGHGGGDREGGFRGGPREDRGDRGGDREERGGGGGGYRGGPGGGGGGYRGNAGGGGYRGGPGGGGGYRGGPGGGGGDDRPRKSGWDGKPREKKYFRKED